MSQLKNLYDLQKEHTGHKICASVFLKLVKNIFHSSKYLENYTQDVDADRHGSSCYCLFLFDVTKLEFVEMHKHIMKLCSASLELLYTDIEGIKMLLKLFFANTPRLRVLSSGMLCSIVGWKLLVC